MRNLVMVFLLLASCGSVSSHPSGGDPCASGAACAGRSEMLECVNGFIEPRPCANNSCEDSSIIFCDRWFETCINNQVNDLDCRGDQLFSCQFDQFDPNNVQRWRWGGWCENGCDQTGCL